MGKKTEPIIIDKDKTLTYFLYFVCVSLGVLVGHSAIELQPSSIEKPIVDVKVDVPDPIIIRDTLTKTEVKYKYITKYDNCCENCKKATQE